MLTPPAKTTPATKTADPCFTHRHLSMAEYGLWNLCRELSHKSNVLYFDGRKMARRFDEHVSPSSVYRTLRSLLGKGWCELLEDRKRGAGGRYAASKYHVLTHVEWVKKYGVSKCRPLVSDDAPVSQVKQVRITSVTGETGKDTRQCQNRPSPVSKQEGTSVKIAPSPVSQVTHNLISTNPMNPNLKTQSDSCPHARAGELARDKASQSFPLPETGQTSKEYTDTRPDPDVRLTMAAAEQIAKDTGFIPQGFAADVTGKLYRWAPKWSNQ